jgi:hypothetical protein
LLKLRGSYLPPKEIEIPLNAQPNDLVPFFLAAVRKLNQMSASPTREQMSAGHLGDGRCDNIETPVGELQREVAGERRRTGCFVID